MGKATILIGPTVVIVLGLIMYGIARLVTKTPQEPKSVRRRAELADDAYLMFKDMLFPKNFDNMDILTPETQANIKAWAEKYGKANS